MDLVSFWIIQQIYLLYRWVRWVQMNMNLWKIHVLWFDSFSHAQKRFLVCSVIPGFPSVAVFPQVAGNRKQPRRLGEPLRPWGRKIATALVYCSSSFSLWFMVIRLDVSSLGIWMDLVWNLEYIILEGDCNSLQITSPAINNTSMVVEWLWSRTYFCTNCRQEQNRH